jgi:hypothetical protein
MFGFAGTAHARTASTEQSAVEAGIDAEVESLLRVGDLTAAEQLLEEHDVRHDINRAEAPPFGSPDGLVTPDAHYGKGSSEVFSSLVHRYGDRYLATGGVNLEGVTASIRDATMVDDACAIVFDSSEWTSPDPTRNNVTL